VAVLAVNATNRNLRNPDAGPRDAGPTVISYQAATALLGQAALEEGDLADFLARAVTVVAGALNVEFVSIMHQPTPGSPLILRAGAGWGAGSIIGEAHVTFGRGSHPGFVMLSNRPIFLDDARTESRFDMAQIFQTNGIVSGVGVVIPEGDRPYGVLSVYTRVYRPFTADEADFLRSVAAIVGSAMHGQRTREQLAIHARDQERRIRYEGAIAECARALLASSGQDRLERAVEALLAATEATYVFVERNVMDPELGFSSRTIVEAEDPNAPGHELGNEYWEVVPWARMPTSRYHMERGEPFVLIPSELEGVEYDLYANDPIPLKSELNIPISVDGEWAGLIGFADSGVRREWNAEDVALLTTAAAMIGAFWEREADRTRLTEVIRSKDDFLATVSHELRTPLTAVLGFGRLLQERLSWLSDDKRDELVAGVVRNGTDLANIVDDLLVAGKAEIDALQVTRVPVDLRAQAAQVIDAFGHGHDNHIEFDGDGVVAMGDPDRIRQILRNLVSNAIRYGGSAIRVETRDHAETASLLVFDDGVGIPHEDRERIFQRYQRAHAARGVSGSFGLGLAISRELARLMSGDLAYRREHGRTVFDLSLPKVA